MNKTMMTIPEVANDLGISRIAVYKKVKSGQIPAARIGRCYLISSKIVQSLLQHNIQEDLDWIDYAVENTFKKYGIVFKWLSTE